MDHKRPMLPVINDTKPFHGATINKVTINNKPLTGLLARITYKKYIENNHYNKSNYSYQKQSVLCDNR